MVSFGEHAADIHDPFRHQGQKDMGHLYETLEVGASCRSISAKLWPLKGLTMPYQRC